MSSARRMLFLLAGLLGAWGSGLAAPGAGALLANATLLRFNGDEYLSHPYTYDLDLSVPGGAGEYWGMVGQTVTIQVGKNRAVTGMVAAVDLIGGTGRRENLHLRLAPPLARLAYRSNTRPYYDLTVPDIVKAVLRQAGFTDFEFRLCGNMAQQELVMQYQESDLAFISRLLEAEGIHYHFAAVNAGERLLFTDCNSALPQLSPNTVRLAEGVQSFRLGQALRTGSVEMSDYDWTRPRANLTGKLTNGDAMLLERVFPAPGHVTSANDSSEQARLRLEAHAARAQACSGESTLAELRPGYRFLLAAGESSRFNQEYVITAVHHRDNAGTYRNTFECVPMAVPLRPTRNTPVPVIAGVVAAIVVGPAGSQKFVDKFGRVKVRFPWIGSVGAYPADKGDTGWVRVLQPASGKGLSGMFLPNVGDEVAVAFEHGDPTRPVVLGGQFNGDSMPPLELPGNAEQTLLRMTSQKGVVTELQFDGNAGHESLTLRAGTEFISISSSGSITTSSAIKSPPAAVANPGQPRYVVPTTAVPAPAVKVVPALP